MHLGKRTGLTRRIPLACAVGVFALTLSMAGAGVGSTSSRFEAGVGVADITPDLGRNFDGYVRPDILATGVATRLWARTLLVKRGPRKIALVSVDLVGALGDMHRALANRVANLGLTENTILLMGSHTHSGPDMMINTTSTPTIEAGNPSADVKAFLVQQIALSVRRAYANLQPAAIGWSSVLIPNASDNRSLEAHLANFGIDAPPHTKTPADDPKGPLDAVDPVLGLLRIDAVKGSHTVPMAAWFRFSAHDTAFPPANDLYTSDWSGISEWRFETELATQGYPGVVALFANGDEGDMVSRNDSYNPYATADSESKKIANGMLVAWAKAGTHMTRQPALDVRTAVICFCGQTFKDQNGSERQVASQGFMGASFLGGAQNGPSIFYQPLQTEGKRRPKELADPVWGRKILAFPVPYPTVVPLSEVRIGDAIIASVPGEPSIEVGRRIQAAMARSGATPAHGIHFTVVVGLAQEYTGYYTTPEEYDKQFYEGGHTVFGKWSSDLVIQAHGDLTRRLLHGEPDPTPGGSLPSSNIGQAPALTGDGGAAGSIAEQPQPKVERMRVVSVRWTGGAAGKDRPLGGPFITLERRGGTGQTMAASVPSRDGRPIAAGSIVLLAITAGVGIVTRRHPRTAGPSVAYVLIGALILVFVPGGPGRASTVDAWHAVTSDLKPGFEWRFDGASSRYTAVFDIPPDFPTGTYRFKITSARYTLVSHSFAVVDSDRLSILGVTARRSGGATLIRFFAANPAPDPNVNLWDRARSPDGGAIVFTHDGEHGRATFDDATRTWIARVPGDANSGIIRVPMHGFTDRWDNTSGPAVTLRIGTVAPQYWPPVMPVGGFCVPGFFGRGCFWPQAVYPWPPGSYPPGGSANGGR